MPSRSDLTSARPPAAASTIPERPPLAAGRCAWLAAALLAGGSHAAVADLLFVPSEFSTIQAAIDAASAGDTVVVEPGLYTENITLRSGIDVRGEEAALTLLRADQVTNPVVTAAGIADMLFANFTLLDSNVGIHVTNSSDVIIANTIFDTLDDFAVDADTPSIVDIVNNVFWDNVTAVRRGSVDTWIMNNIFARNIETLASSAFVDLHTNVSFNCFFANDDLADGDNDTGLGTDFQLGDPLFVDTQAGDFHLRFDSPCIDAGSGMDVIDDTVADIGAYGGPFADPWPFPVPQPQIEDTSGPGSQPVSITVTWEPNLDYRVENPANPGSYRVYYSLNQPGPPYDGTDAGGGTEPSPIDVGNVTSYELADLTPAAQDPSPPQLTAAEPRNEAVVLSWSGVEDATAYRVHYGVASTEENQVDVGDETSFTVTGLQNGVAHLFTVTALSQPTYFIAVTVLDNTPEQHESLFSEEASIPVGEVVESLPSNELTATPDEIHASPDVPEDRCFVATAAYSPAAPEVLALREFRDRYLRTHAAGRRLVAGYYALSPQIARYIDDHPGLKPAVRAALLPAVGLALFMLEADGTAKGVAAALSLLVVVSIAWRRRRAGRR